MRKQELIILQHSAQGTRLAVDLVGSRNSFNGAKGPQAWLPASIQRLQPIRLG